MEFDFLRIIGLVSVFLLTSLVILGHYFLYADKGVEQEFQDTNILYKIACLEFRAFFILVSLFFLFVICPVVGLLDSIVSEMIDWYKTRHCRNENQEYEIDVDSSIPVAELIKASGLTNKVDIQELQALINNTAPNPKGKIKVNLIHMKNLITFTQRLQLLEDSGLKPADPIHLLTFVAKFPRITKGVRIYAYGTPRNNKSGLRTFLGTDNRPCLCWQTETSNDGILSSDPFGRMLAISKDCE